MKKTILLSLLSLFTVLVVEAQSVYTPMKEFLFEVQTTVGNEKEVQYISMWATDDVWKMDSTQRQLFYAYHKKHCNKDSLTPAWPYSDNVESTGIIETENRIWLHPPRWNNLEILEYFPFPEINKNALCGDKYKRMFLGSVDFLDRWMFLRYKMTVKRIGNKTIIQGKAKSRRGEWTEVITYDSEKGFTEMEFTTPVGRTIKLKLIDIIEHKNNCKHPS